MEYTITYSPDFDQTRQDMGYDVHDDYDNNAVLYQQGYNMRNFTIEAGETFKIKREQSRATFQCDGTRIRLFAVHPMFDEIEDEDNISLEPGKYILHLDGKSIERLDVEDDDFY
ncbi:hypothetical protein SCB49_02439 [unidentified eubacterium SCB49]|nr:hypothetical protein SCB49_02439 [unidentified eubacterium SCB49]